MNRINAAPAVIVVVPAYNEVDMIGSVVQSLRPYAGSIIVVDDGSSDGTGEAARRAGAHVLRHAINLGQGAALQTGIDYALIKSADIIVTFDADGQHDPGDIPGLLLALEKNSADIALGSRFLGRAIGLGMVRKNILHLAAFHTWLFTGLKITDTQNGLRAIRASAAIKLHIQQNRMAHASEIIAKIKSLDLRYVEAPCTVCYTDYSLRKGQKLSNGLLILCDLLLKRIR